MIIYLFGRFGKRQGMPLCLNFCWIGLKIHHTLKVFNEKLAKFCENYLDVMPLLTARKYFAVD